MIKVLSFDSAQDFDRNKLEQNSQASEDIQATVEGIIAGVRERGDEALVELTAALDGANISKFAVPHDLIAKTTRLVDPKVAEALTVAAANIEDFARKQLPKNSFDVRADGSFVGTRITPIASVGIYVPGGRALYPSTVLMNAIPAKVAGVRRIVMATPPDKNGQVDPVILYAAALAGVTEIYTVGGAQAIAALAYGTDQIAKVDKITGPGNAYVACAKRLVSGDVGIDMIAGPSEVLILADETSEPALIAIDMLAQAEHDPMASAYLVTTDETLVADVQADIEDFLEDSPRAEITREALENNARIIVADNLATAIGISNAIAPEHLEIQMDGAFELLGLIENAGAIFLGQWTPESVGDYYAGPNHTLPTGGTARFAGPLSVEDFVKRSSVISFSQPALAQAKSTIETLAASEGLWAHGKAVRSRFELLEDDE